VTNSDNVPGAGEQPDLAGRASPSAPVSGPSTPAGAPSTPAGAQSGRLGAAGTGTSAATAATGNATSSAAGGRTSAGGAATGTATGKTAAGETSSGSPAAGSNPAGTPTGSIPRGSTVPGSAGQSAGGLGAGSDASVDYVADMVLARIKDKLDESRDSAADISAPEIPSAEHAIALREQAPELYDLWLKIAQEKAATENYVDRAPYEVPERLAQSGRPRALGALIIVLSFCGYLAWLGGPGPYIGGLIAILDLGAMFGMFFGLRPESLPENHRTERNRHLRGAGPPCPPCLTGGGHTRALLLP
jgi:hypothetical protein